MSPDHCGAISGGTLLMIDSRVCYRQKVMEYVRVDLHRTLVDRPSSRSVLEHDFERGRTIQPSCHVSSRCFHSEKLVAKGGWKSILFIFRGSTTLHAKGGDVQLIRSQQLCVLTGGLPYNSSHFRLAAQHFGCPNT